MVVFFIFLFEYVYIFIVFFFFFQAEDGIRDGRVTGVQTCALPIWNLAGPGGLAQWHGQSCRVIITLYEDLRNVVRGAGRPMSGIVQVPWPTVPRSLGATG